MEDCLTEIRMGVFASVPEEVIDVLLNNEEYLQWELSLLNTFVEWVEEEKTTHNRKLLKRKYNKFITWQVKKFLPGIIKRAIINRN